MNTIRRALAPSADFQLAELGDESLIFNRATKRTIYLNPAATVIWRLCDGERSVDEIISLLREAYNDPAIDFASDVHSGIEAMLNEGALRWVDPRKKLSTGSEDA